MPTIRVLSNSPYKVNKARLEAGKGGKGWQTAQKAAVKALMEGRRRLIKSLKAMQLATVRWRRQQETRERWRTRDKGRTSCRMFRHA